ncbi:GNAT family N-acetyltransferase [Spirochaeta dissipatitropha]
MQIKFEFDSDSRINEYLKIEFGELLFQNQKIYESQERNAANIFETRFPIIETEFNQQIILSIPTHEIRKDLNFINPIRNAKKIEQLFLGSPLRILEVYRYIITNPIVSNEKESLYPTHQDVSNYYPKFNSNQITEYLDEKRILCVKDDSDEIVGMCIVTRRRITFSELSIHIKPENQKKGSGFRLLKMAVNHELNLGRFVVLVTERKNHSANSLIQKFNPERKYIERIAIV